MTYKLNWALVSEKLQNKKITLFTPSIFLSLFNISHNTGKSLLSAYTQKGFFIKLKNGFYITKSPQPNDFEIANKIYMPSYVSFETALSYHNVLPEIVYSITSATTKASRNYVILNKYFTYHKIKKELFFGYDAITIGGQTIWMADKEKALLDYLYFVTMKKKPENDRLYLKEMSTSKIKKYLKQYNNPLLEAKIKKLLITK
jgi:predicted transcriptional regulator of viral defense system